MPVFLGQGMTEFTLSNCDFSVAITRFFTQEQQSFPRFFVVSFKVIQWKKDSFKPIAISNIPYRGYFGEKGGVQNIGSGNSFSIFVIIFFISTLMIFH